MTTKKTIVYGFIAVILALAFTACSKSGGGGQKLTGPNDAFKFTLIDGGKAYSVSAGTAVEGTVNIPSHFH